MQYIEQRLIPTEYKQAHWLKSKEICNSLLSFPKKIQDTVIETIWPTQCVICNKEDYLLCPACRRKLLYIDTWQCCNKCGSSGGLIQCCECNSYVKAECLNEALSLNSCSSVTCFTHDSAAIVRAYKDKGERRLARVMAQMMARYCSPHVLKYAQFITYIPASEDALIKRGFDHIALIAKELSLFLHLPYKQTLAIPHSQDQRRLGRNERSENASDAFTVMPGINLAEAKILLIDDVRTTGATLSGAASTLREAGALRIDALTFARVS